MGSLTFILYGVYINDSVYLNLGVKKWQFQRKEDQKPKRMHKANWKIAPITLVACKNCGAMIKPHFICSECGVYNGKQVIELPQEEPSTKEA